MNPCLRFLIFVCRNPAGKSRLHAIVSASTDQFFYACLALSLCLVTAVGLAIAFKWVVSGLLDTPPKLETPNTDVLQTVFVTVLAFEICSGSLYLD